MNREAVSSLYFACPDTFATSFINQTEEYTGAATKLTVKTITLIYNFSSSIKLQYYYLH